LSVFKRGCAQIGRRSGRGFKDFLEKLLICFRLLTSMRGFKVDVRDSDQKGINCIHGLGIEEVTRIRFKANQVMITGNGMVTHRGQHAIARIVTRHQIDIFQLRKAVLRSARPSSSLPGMNELRGYEAFRFQHGMWEEMAAWLLFW
jgi:hypothetical protein